jgi:hypothetical protein
MTKRKFNPIDKDKVVENPGLLPFAHTVGSAIIKPIDKGKVKGVAMSAMYQQTEKQLVDLKEQVEHLLKKAQTVHEKIEISEKIYAADCGFKPLPGHTYYLYEKKKKKEWVLSMVASDEWGSSSPYDYLAKVQLMADHTWDVLESELNSELEA